MPKKIAILHTSFVFVSVEPAINDLIAELIPDAEVMHFVDSDVLATVVREQGISSQSEARMTHLAQAAEAAGADVIFSACSSLGPALDVAARSVGTPVVKIDEAMAMQAAREGTRIGVLATVPTTLGPTSDLIQAQADEIGRSITIEQRLCDGAFQSFEHFGPGALRVRPAVRRDQTIHLAVQRADAPCSFGGAPEPHPADVARRFLCADPWSLQSDIAQRVVKARVVLLHRFLAHHTPKLAQDGRTLPYPGQPRAPARGKRRVAPRLARGQLRNLL